MKKLLSIMLVVLLLAGMAVTGTMAYLTSEDSDVNVMTLGNVKIEQIELQRAEGVAHNAAAVDGDLVPFEQGQALLPAVPKNNAASDYTAEANDLFKWGPYVTAESDDAAGTAAANGLWNEDKLSGAMDKFVFVKNTGKSDAYYRTLIAFECPEDITIGEPAQGAEIMININGNTRFDWEDLGYITVDGVRYAVLEATYNKVLEPGKISRPSLLQVVMTHNATNEDMELLGDEYTILVLSQAVQTNGFADAATALETAFPKGDNNANVAEWFSGSKFGPVEMVSTLDELKAAFEKGGNIVLTEDIKFDKITTIEPGKEVHLNLNGKTITVDENTTSNTLIWVKDGAKLTVDGNGTFDLGSVSTMAIFAPYGELVIENGTFTRDKVTTVTNATTGLFMGAKSVNSNVTINGGYFDPGYYDNNAADIEEILAGTKPFSETDADIATRGKPGDENLVRVAVKDNVSVVLNHSGYGTFKVYGGTFVGANPAWGDEGCMLPTTPTYLRPWSYYQGPLLAGQTYNENGLVIPDGYTIIKGATTEGIPTYTVEYGK